MPSALNAAHLAGQTITAADENAQSAAVNAATAGVYNVKEAAYGAKGDGTTDDTAAIQAALTACATAGGGQVYLPPGTYVVAPTTTARLAVGSNTRVRGAGMGNTVVKVKANAGDYDTIFGATTNSTAVSNVTYSDFAVDQNPSGNTTCNVQSTGNAWQHAITHDAGNDFVVERVAFDPCCGVNTAVFNGSGLQRVRVAFCRFHFQRAPSTAVLDGVVGLYDNSALYAECFDHRFVGNQFWGNPATDHPFGCMESHGGPAVITGNVGDGYETLLNVVGDSATQTRAAGDNSITVVGNTAYRANIAIKFWTSGAFPLRNVTVAGNTIGISQVEHSYSHCNGIAFDPGSTGLFDNILIADNTITHVYEGVGGRNTWRGSGGIDPTHTAGIGVFPGGDLSNVLVVGNVIKLAPVKGIDLEPGGNATNVRFLNNVIVDAGQNAAIATGAWRAAFFALPASAKTFTDVEFAGNRIYDDGSPSKYGDQAFYAQATGTCTRCAIRGNSVQALTGTLSVANLLATAWGRDYGSATFGGSVLNAATETTFTIAVLGAVLGDMVDVVPDTTLEGNLAITGAWVSAADTVTVRLRNMNVSGGTNITPASRTWYAYLTKRPF